LHQTNYASQENFIPGAFYELCVVSEVVSRLIFMDKQDCCLNQSMLRRGK